MDVNTVLVIAGWFATVGTLAVQNQANTNSLRARQDLTNDHLKMLNDKTFTSHREIGQIIGAVEALPCRTLGTKGCPVLTRQDKDDGKR